MIQSGATGTRFTPRLPRLICQTPTNCIKRANKREKRRERERTKNKQKKERQTERKEKKRRDDRGKREERERDREERERERERVSHFLQTLWPLMRHQVVPARVRDANRA